MANELKPVEIVAEPNPALANPAIARCAKAWEDAYREQMEEEDSDYGATQRAAEAYRAALPPLTSRDNCRDFIACVAHGILLGAIPETNAGKLLYAAQVALGAVSAEERSREMAGYAAYANLSEAQTTCLKKLLPQRRKIA
ncbi:MAG: hypothetical protein WAL45_03730 [Terracidiphilus sp.]